MAYNEALNKKIDETKIGTEIKNAFKRSYKVAKYLNKVANDAIEPDGEFTSELIGEFTETDKTEMKAWINAIDAVTTGFIDGLDLINNPEDTE